MRHITQVFLFLAACEGEPDPCPRVPLEVRAFTGEAVEGNAIRCEGGRGWCEWTIDAEAYRSHCGADLTVRVAQFVGGRFEFHLAVDELGQVSEAFAISGNGCDGGGCDTTIQPGRGWIMPEETSFDGAIRGRYSVTLDEGYYTGLYEGEYDVVLREL